MKTIVPTTGTIILANQMLQAAARTGEGAGVALDLLPHCQPGQEVALVGVLLDRGRHATTAVAKPPLDLSAACWAAAAAAGDSACLTDLQVLRSASHDATQARRIAMTAVHYIGGGYSPIGRFFERNHATVVAAVRKVTSDPEADNQAKQIAAMLRGQTSTENMDG